jgi:tRNA A-37 threonylcarbamoyl transferase component Bud32
MLKQNWQSCWSCGASVAVGSRRCLSCGASQVQEQPDHWSGRQIGQYEIIQRIGHGGMGMVYEAAHLQTGYHYAIKILHPHLCEDEVMVERLRREAQIAATLQHQHLAHVFDFGCEPDVGFFLVMELLQGDELASVLLNYPILSLSRVREIVLQVCDALELAHRHQVVHRDLKPGNLFLLMPEQGFANVKVLDFGIARLLSTPEAAQQLTGFGSSLGTPDYMPPEQIMGRAEKIGPTSDIYALSVLTYRLLTGRLPLEGQNLVKLLNQVMFKKPPLLSVYAPLFRDSWLEALLFQGMSKNPHERPHSIKDFRMRFEDALEGDPRLYPLLAEAQAGWAPNHQVVEAEVGQEIDPSLAQEGKQRFQFGGETYRFEGAELVSESDEGLTAVGAVPVRPSDFVAESSEHLQASTEGDYLYSASPPNTALPDAQFDDDEGPTRMSPVKLPPSNDTAIKPPPPPVVQSSKMPPPSGWEAQTHNPTAAQMPVFTPAPPLRYNKPAPATPPPSSLGENTPPPRSILSPPPAAGASIHQAETKQVRLNYEKKAETPTPLPVGHSLMGTPQDPLAQQDAATRILPPVSASASSLDEPTRSVMVGGTPSPALSDLNPSDRTMMLPNGSASPSSGRAGVSLEQARGSSTTVERKSSRIPKPAQSEGMPLTEPPAEKPRTTERVRVADTPLAIAPPPPPVQAGLRSLMMGFLFGLFLIAGALSTWLIYQRLIKNDASAGDGQDEALYSLEIRSNPEGARVVVQGRSLGSTPLLISRKRGEVLDFVVIKTGYSMAAERWEAQKSEKRLVILLKQ